MCEQRKLTLLAPARDLEIGIAAIQAGADAVYIGGEKYSVRANAINFTLDQIKEGCDFAHKLGKKVYLTLKMGEGYIFEGWFK